jgi:hypothetical protein
MSAALEFFGAARRLPRLIVVIWPEPIPSKLAYNMLNLLLSVLLAVDVDVAPPAWRFGSTATAS